MDVFAKFMTELAVQAHETGSRLEALDEDVVQIAGFAVHRDLDFARFSRSVQSKDVNCEPWSVFMISGGPNSWIVSFSASR
ncbi:hypothetical protein [Pseudotabrizicola formosa]|uniref:hypothetical protein n=1 Tax=Pseudotabrizicola formosa TaxID=2030009 RepID=UPI0011AFC3D4|nr:hypothetical protein [Pseudotabrizicola formosa]